jgi:aryl-alcohol dehydrogenase-like predicted oxidoreductase
LRRAGSTPRTSLPPGAEPLRQITVAGTDLRVSRFAFGTARLHHIGGLAEQVALLEAAAEAGFTHFDTAPLYGFGGAERALGEAFASTRKITIATKVGLYPPGGKSQGRGAMWLRKLAGKALPSLSLPQRDLAVDRARASLEASLKHLGRDHVDLLLLHEPDIALLQRESWLRWLEEEAGRIGAVGVAGPSSVVTPFLCDDGPLTQVIQVRDGLVSHEAEPVLAAGRPLQLTYGYFTGDGGGRSSSEIIRGALERNTTGAILVSTRNRERLREFAALAQG